MTATTLALLQGAGLLLIALSALLVALLVLMGLRERRIRRARAARRGALQGYLFAAINTTLAMRVEHLPPLDQRDDPLVCLDMMLDLFRQIDGVDMRPAIRTYILWGQLPALLRLARHGDTATRIKALTLMGRLEDSDSEAALIAALQSTGQSERLVAVCALAERGARHHIGRVLAAMAAGPRASDRLYADALIRFGPDIAGTLLAWLDRLQDAPVALAAAVRALAEWEMPGAAHEVAACLVHADARVRAAALHTLDRLGAAPGDAVLDRLLDDPAPVVRLALAASAPVSPGMFHALCRLLDDGDGQVALRAARSMSALGDRGRAYLCARAADAPPHVHRLCRHVIDESDAAFVAAPAWTGA